VLEMNPEFDQLVFARRKGVEGLHLDPVSPEGVDVITGTRQPLPDDRLPAGLSAFDPEQDNPRLDFDDAEAGAVGHPVVKMQPPWEVDQRRPCSLYLEEIRAATDRKDKLRYP